MPKKKIDFNPNYDVKDANEQSQTSSPLVARFNNHRSAVTENYEVEAGKRVCGAVLELVDGYLTDTEYEAVIIAMMAAVPGKLSGIQIFAKAQIPEDVEGYTQNLHVVMHPRYDKERVYEEDAVEEPIVE